MSCTAASLFTLQINAPSGGAGHRTSVRGGGPLTTLVVGTTEQTQTLWHKIWYNVLTLNDFNHFLGKPKMEYTHSTIFPWCCKTQISKNDAKILPSDAHPLQVYWCMPRRIRLILNKNKTESMECSLCGVTCFESVSEFITKNYGNNYSDLWQHPLSPYYISKENLRLAIHPQPGGIGYKHWLALTLGEGEPNKNLKKIPAFIVTANEKRLRGERNHSLKTWAFGYDMDNMKARCWYEAKLPLYHLTENQTNEKPINLIELRYTIQDLINTAEQARSYLSQSLNQCKQPTSIANQKFWQQTEAFFYTTLEEIIHCKNDDELENIKRRWLKDIQKQARKLFHTTAKIYHFKPEKTEAIFEARKFLLSRLYGKKIYGLLRINKKPEAINA